MTLFLYILCLSYFHYTFNRFLNQMSITDCFFSEYFIRYQDDYAYVVFYINLIILLCVKNCLNQDDCVFIQTPWSELT